MKTILFNHSCFREQEASLIITEIVLQRIKDFAWSEIQRFALNDDDYSEWSRDDSDRRLDDDDIYAWTESDDFKEFIKELSQKDRDALIQISECKSDDDIDISEWEAYSMSEQKEEELNYPTRTAKDLEIADLKRENNAAFEKIQELSAELVRLGFDPTSKKVMENTDVHPLDYKEPSTCPFCGGTPCPCLHGSEFCPESPEEKLLRSIFGENNDPR